MKKHTPWRRPIWLCALLAFGLHALRSFVICPLNVAVNANIIYASTIWPMLVDVLVDLTMMAIIYICYALILDTLFREGFARALPLMLIYLGSSVFGAAGNLIMDMTVGGASADIFDLLLLATVGGLVQELAQLALVLLIACLLARGYRGPYAPVGLFSCRNRLQLAALLAAAVTALFRLGGRLIYDIDLGMPATPIEVMDMVVGYGSDLLIPFLGYLGMVLILMGRPNAEAAAQIEED